MDYGLFNLLDASAWYWWNSMVNVPRPLVIDRKSVVYLNVLESDIVAEMISMFPSLSVWLI